MIDLSDTTMAFLFPGVGVGLSGQEKPFFEDHREIMSPLLEQASDVAHADLLAPLQGGQRLEGEQATHLFTYALSCAAADVYRAGGLKPAIVAGHSLGIYATLYAAGVLDYASGMQATDLARRIVARASARGDYSMAVVVGLLRAEVSEALSAAGLDSVVIVNENNETSLVLAGTRQQLEAGCGVLKGRDALKAVLLPVKAPYHHPRFLPPATEEFARRLNELDWRGARHPVVSPIDQQLLTDPAELRELTARNLSTPINWAKVVTALVTAGVKKAVECGPGISLAQNARMMDQAPKIVTLKGGRRWLESRPSR